jgi:hypothetical protein
MTGSLESPVRAFWGGMTCDVGDPGDRRASRPHPLPGVIPDWRALARVHPKSSQIGVGFSDFLPIGVGLREIPFVLLRVLCG